MWQSCFISESGRGIDFDEDCSILWRNLMMETVATEEVVVSETGGDTRIQR